MIKKCSIREAEIGDIASLHELEQKCFASDRLNRRRFRYWIAAPNRVFLVAENADGVQGYGLAILHRGTRSARLYSLAVSPAVRGQGVADLLLHAIESLCADKGRLYMRLEVASTNSAAIGLYMKQGYTVFGSYAHYYEDDRDALRMQKRIRYLPANLLTRTVPWYRQATEFTCGPAALMMAMASLDPNLELSLKMELDIWRVATTIFMTSGHGGCHPLGLAIAARNLGFNVEVCLNKTTPLFIDSVRSPLKKSVLAVVDEQFHEKAANLDIQVNYDELSQDQIETWIHSGAMVIVLVSTYRMDGKKTPHWVTVTGMDDVCLYVHDPHVDRKVNVEIDCQHIPIAREDFTKMSAFGSERLRTAVALRKTQVKPLRIS
jgi:ribosomal protein S18 acetylase RimI-like enzyme